MDFMQDRKRLAQQKADAWSKRNQSAFEGLLNVNQFMPITGDIQSGLLAAQDLGQGNYDSAALNALGLLPFVPALGGTTKTLYRGLSQPYNPEVKNTIEWFSETPELAKKYGENIITKNIEKPFNAFDFGFRDYMTEVKKNDVLSRVKQGVIDSFNNKNIDKETALNQIKKLESLKDSKDDFKKVHEWISQNPEIAKILKKAKYDAISHIEQGSQTYGILK